MNDLCRMLEWCVVTTMVAIKFPFRVLKWLCETPAKAVLPFCLTACLTGSLRADNNDEKMHTVVKILEGLDKKIGNLDQRLDRIEKDAAETRDKLSSLEKKYSSVTVTTSPSNRSGSSTTTTVSTGYPANYSGQIPNYKRADYLAAQQRAVQQRQYQQQHARPYQYVATTEKAKEPEKPKEEKKDPPKEESADPTGKWMLTATGRWSFVPKAHVQYYKDTYGFKEP